MNAGAVILLAICCAAASCQENVPENTGVYQLGSTSVTDTVVRVVVETLRTVVRETLVTVHADTHRTLIVDTVRTVYMEQPVHEQSHTQEMTQPDSSLVFAAMVATQEVKTGRVSKRTFMLLTRNLPKFTTVPATELDTVQVRLVALLSGVRKEEIKEVRWGQSFAPPGHAKHRASFLSVSSGSHNWTIVSVDSAGSVTTVSRDR
jgi:hypothetical protein